MVIFAYYCAPFLFYIFNLQTGAQKSKVLCRLRQLKLIKFHILSALTFVKHIHVGNYIIHNVTRTSLLPFFSSCFPDFHILQSAGRFSTASSDVYEYRCIEQLAARSRATNIQHTRLQPGAFSITTSRDRIAPYIHYTESSECSSLEPVALWIDSDTNTSKQIPVLIALVGGNLRYGSVGNVGWSTWFDMGSRSQAKITYAVSWEKLLGITIIPIGTQ